LSARLNRYCDHLRRPSGWLPLPGSSPVIGRHAPAVIRSPLGRGGPLQFPPPLSERSEPLTPGSPSRLRFQALHRFLGLRPSTPGSALPAPHPRMGQVTTRQASLHVTDRSVAHPQDWGARRWASTPPVSRQDRQPATGPPGSYPDRTHTGKRRRAYDSVVNHSHDQPPIYWTHSGTSTRCSSKSVRRPTTCGGRWTSTGDVLGGSYPRSVGYRRTSGHGVTGSAPMSTAARWPTASAPGTKSAGAAGGPGGTIGTAGVGGYGGYGGYGGIMGGTG